MDATKKRRGVWLLCLLALVALTVIGGWKWMEYTSTQENERAQILAQDEQKAQKEKNALARKLAAAEKVASEGKREEERLQAENALLNEKLLACKKPVVKKRTARIRTKKKMVVAAKQETKQESQQKAIVPTPPPLKQEEAPVPKEEKKKEEKEKEVPPAPEIPVAQAPPSQVSGYQIGGACTLSDGTPGMVTATFRNGNVQCSEVVLVPVPSKAKAAAQYIVCTAAGAAVGYYNGGTYSAISGGVGGAGGVYAGRTLGGEDWGWVGCVTGPAAGFIKWPTTPGSSAASGPSGGGTGIGGATGPSGGGTGIGEVVVGGGTGI